MAYLSTYRAWPFCQADIEVSPLSPSKFPVSITEDTLFKWMYRVKTWQIDFNVTADIDVLDGRTISASGVETLTRTEPSELSFLCNSPEFVGFDTFYTVGTVTQLNAPDPPSIEDVDCQIQFVLGASQDDDENYGAIGNNHWLRDAVTSGNFLPSLNFYIDFKNAITSASEVIVANYENEFFPSSGFTIPGTIDGVSFDAVAYSPTVVGLTGSIDITPVEFWPYDPGDGLGPVWDSVSGAPIRDRFSVQRRG